MEKYTSVTVHDANKQNAQYFAPFIKPHEMINWRFLSYNPCLLALVYININNSTVYPYHYVFIINFYLKQDRERFACRELERLLNENNQTVTQTDSLSSVKVS